MSPDRKPHSAGNPESQEAYSPIKIGINEETDKLRTVAIWGPVGAEACLTQLFPENISLFLSHMDVPRARGECTSFAQTLRQSFDVKVIEIRDELAKTLTPHNLIKVEIQRQLLEKADAITHKYQPDLTQAQIDENKNSILHLLNEDIQKYGQDRALTLNRILCLTRFLPLGDALYARDQMNVLLGKKVTASMAKPIRKPEVALYNMIYNKILDPENTIAIPTSETFEGGDAYIHNGIIYIGVGTRTSLGAVKHIYRELWEEIKQHGVELAIVVDPKPFKKSPRDQMDSMHLDTFSMPTGPKQMLVSETEATRRNVSIAKANGSEVEFVKTGKNFLQFLESQGEEIIILPDNEQKSFGANLLVVDKGNILVSLDSNKETIDQLKKTGKNIVNLDLAQCTKGYGAAHCMTGQLQRVPE